MAELIRMPKMSDTMQQGTIKRWLKQVGDAVAAGDILAEVETDKALMELEAYEDGTLLYIGKEVHSVAQVNEVIAIIGEAGEDIEPLLQKKPISLSAVRGQDEGGVSEQTIPSVQKEKEVDRFFASPLAKKMAKEKGCDITQIEGSGEFGRVIKKDVIHFYSSLSKKKENLLSLSESNESYEDISISAMRQNLAMVLTKSKREAPHFYLTMGIEMGKAIALRAELNSCNEVKISINDLVVRATALALTSHAKVNAAWLEDKIRLYQHIHIGVAVALEDGLIVPVVRFADQKPLIILSKEIKILSERAQQKKLTAQECRGSTFTISNLGMFGIEEFSAIINLPAACTLAVGALRKIPIVEEEKIGVGYRMKVTLSCDHRVMDGAVAALFLSTLKGLIEQPLRLLM